MVDGNKCENCQRIVPEPKARRKQTKYCAECARAKKRAGAQNSWSADTKAAYMRKYMRKYRKSHPRLSTSYVRKHREKLRASSDAGAYLSSVAIPLWFLIAILFADNLNTQLDALPGFISYLELLVIKVTGLIIIILICLRHLKRFWKEK